MLGIWTCIFQRNLRQERRKLTSYYNIKMDIREAEYLTCLFCAVHPLTVLWLNGGSPNVPNPPVQRTKTFYQGFPFGCLSGFSVSVFYQGFPSGVFVWVLRQRLLSGFSVWGVCLGSPSASSVRVFRLGVCLGSPSASSVRVSGVGCLLGSPSASSVRVFFLGCLSSFSFSLFCHVLFITLQRLPLISEVFWLS